MDDGETPEEAMFRELREETGLLPHHVDVLGRTRDWLKYDLPEHLVRHNSHPVCIGQKQVWFLLQFRGTAKDVDLVNHGDKPEFDDWSWVDYDLPATQVVNFKQDVYQRAMQELKHLIGHR
jgi:putative (di)nucleoside polyphosphate hydrolase